MHKKEIKQILNLNREFYQSVSKDFSKTRQKPWKGWDRVADNLQTYFKNKKSSRRNVRVLDLGCGNGRFFDFISLKIRDIKYTGIDINNDLLNEGKEKYQKLNNKLKFKFVKKDILKNIRSIKNKYDVIVSFGFTHHIPNKVFRKTWFSSLPIMLGENGIIVLTFWQFDNIPGDYLVGWDNKKNTYRYCYQYSIEDINNLIDSYKRSNLKLIDDYFEDNRNRYLIFGKI